MYVKIPQRDVSDLCDQFFKTNLWVLSMSVNKSHNYFGKPLMKLGAGWLKRASIGSSLFVTIE